MLHVHYNPRDALDIVDSADCAVRALTKALRVDYCNIHLMAEVALHRPLGKGVAKTVLSSWLRGHPETFRPMLEEDDSEFDGLPLEVIPKAFPKGTFICMVRYSFYGHIFAMVDGVVYDDSRDITSHLNRGSRVFEVWEILN